MERIQVTITSRLLTKLDEESEQLEISRSELIRRILDKHYQQGGESHEHR